MTNDHVNPYQSLYSLVDKINALWHELQAEITRHDAIRGHEVNVDLPEVPDFVVSDAYLNGESDDVDLIEEYVFPAEKPELPGEPAGFVDYKPSAGSIASNILFELVRAKTVDRLRVLMHAKESLAEAVDIFQIELPQPVEMTFVWIYQVLDRLEKVDSYFREVRLFVAGAEDTPDDPRAD